MATYQLDDDPQTTDVRPVNLSAEERDFIDFLLYQFGSEYAETDEASKWMDVLTAKFE